MVTERMTRRRKGGTLSTMPANGVERIAAFRSIVAEKQYAMIDGFMVDLYSASAVVSVYDGLNETNREKFAALKAPIMADITFRLLNKSAR